MKNILNISLVLVQMMLFTSCKNAVTKTAPTTEPKKVINADTVAHTERHELKLDTIIHLSKPFMLNGISMYWEKHSIMADDSLSDTYLILKNKKTNQLLIETPSIYSDSINNADGYYRELNKQCFKDYNFDGFQDASFYKGGSTAMTSMIAIYIFNSKTKTFSYSEELSDTTIESIDAAHKKLTTYSEGRDFGVTQIHYFNTNGTIKYTEVIQEYSKYVDSVEFPVDYKLYEKIVNGKVVETKKDSIIYKGN